MSSFVDALRRADMKKFVSRTRMKFPLLYAKYKWLEDGPVKRFQSRARISVLVDVAVSVIIS